MDRHKRYQGSPHDEVPEKIYADLLYTLHYPQFDERLLRKKWDLYT